AHGDGVELHGRAPGRSHAFFHALSEPPVIEVARHRFGPRGGDAHEGTFQIFLRKSDAMQHGARGRARGSVEQTFALCTKIAGHVNDLSESTITNETYALTARHVASTTLVRKWAYRGSLPHTTARYARCSLAPTVCAPVAKGRPSISRTGVTSAA